MPKPFELFKALGFECNFEQIQTSPMSTTTVMRGWHWTNPERSESNGRLTDFGQRVVVGQSGHPIDFSQRLVVSDEYCSWANPWNGSQCYEVDYFLRRPLVLLEQFAELEKILEDPTYMEFLNASDFDSVVYTPHEYGKGRRQALLFDPVNQIVSARPFDEFDTAIIYAYRHRANAGWWKVMKEKEPEQSYDTYSSYSAPQNNTAPAHPPVATPPPRPFEPDEARGILANLEAKFRKIQEATPSTKADDEACELAMDIIDELIESDRMAMLPAAVGKDKYADLVCDIADIIRGRGSKEQPA